MSDSLALFRKNASTDLQKLAEEHLQQDLTANDRELLKSAGSTLSTHITIGSLIGVGLGAFLAVRVRQNRIRMFEAFKTARKPEFIRFADGKEEAIPDLTPLLKPTPFGDFATYTFFGIAGVFLGGEIGLLTGASSSKRKITGDPETKKRVEDAMRAFRRDVLRQQLKDLETKEGGSEGLGFGF